MDNQHRKIIGYRELDQEEIDLMNRVKALGPAIESVLVDVQEFIKNQKTRGSAFEQEAVLARHEDATPERFAALAKTDFQTALMYLTRSVAQPTFF